MSNHKTTHKIDVNTFKSTLLKILPHNRVIIFPDSRSALQIQRDIFYSCGIMRNQDLLALVENTYNIVIDLRYNKQNLNHFNIHEFKYTISILDWRYCWNNGKYFFTFWYYWLFRLLTYYYPFQNLSIINKSETIRNSIIQTI